MVDKDLLSIQEARSLVRAAKTAQATLADLDQERIDSIVKAIAVAAREQAEPLAALAVEETGFGKVQDKKTKNILASEKLYEAIKDMKTFGVLSNDEERKLLKLLCLWELLQGLSPLPTPHPQQFISPSSLSSQVTPLFSHLIPAQRSVSGRQWIFFAACCMTAACPKIWSA